MSVARERATEGRRRRTRLQVLAIAAALLLIAPFALTSRSSETLAIWQDTEFASGEFTAKRIPAPTIVGCRINRGTLGGLNGVSVDFLLPDGYDDASKLVWGVGTSPGSLTAVTPQPGSGSGNSRRATISSGLLGGILGTLLGANFYVGTYTGDDWVSKTVLTHFTIAGLLGSDSCTINAGG